MTQEIYDNICQSLETLHLDNLRKGLNPIQVEMVLMSFQIILNENLELSKQLEALKAEKAK